MKETGAVPAERVVMLSCHPDQQSFSVDDNIAQINEQSGAPSVFTLRFDGGRPPVRGLNLRQSLTYTVTPRALAGERRRRGGRSGEKGGGEEEK